MRQRRRVFRSNRVNMCHSRVDRRRLRFRLLACAVILTGVLIPSSSVSAATTTREFLISDASSNQLSPAIEISGNMVVWEDYRNGNGDIFALNLSVRQEIQITTDLNTQKQPAISGNTIVWEDNRSGNWDIYGYNLVTQAEFPIVTASGDQRKPEISGNTVVWEDRRSGDWDVYRYDLATQSEAPIATGPGEQTRPEISAGTVVWENGNGDIDGYALASGTTFSVTSSSGWQDTPVISGTTVAWRDGRNGNYDIYGKDLATGVEFPISTGPTDEVSPAMSELSSAISGLVVVWSDTRNGEGDIYGLDLATDERFPVTLGAGWDDRPAISGRVVVWERQRPGDPQFGSYDIYGALITDPDAPTVTASPAGGVTRDPVSVRLTASEPATIYYTTNGTAPSTSSSRYVGPITVGSPGTTTLHFIAVDRGNNASQVMTELYTTDAVSPVVSASPAAGAFGGPQAVTLAADDATATTIYYTTDGTTPTTSSPVFIDPIDVSQTTTIEFFGVDAAGNASSITTATFTIDTTPPVIAASPGGGSYFEAQAVTLSMDEQATIYYCRTDGCTPTTSSTVYSGPISITATTTLQFFGVDVFGNTSGVTTESYLISTDPETPSITSAPQAAIKTSGAIASTGKVPLLVTWSGTDNLAVTRYELQISSNGGASWAAVKLKSLTATSLSTTLLPSANPYQYRVRAFDAAGNVSPFADGPAFVVRAIQEDDPSLLETGAWITEAMTGSVGGSVQRESAAGATASLEFTGTSVCWVTARGPASGKAEVWLDGARVASLDLYSSKTQVRKLAWGRNGLSAGTHVLEIRVLGTKKTSSTGTNVIVDEIVVLQ